MERLDSKSLFAQKFTVQNITFIFHMSQWPHIYAPKLYKTYTLRSKVTSNLKTTPYFVTSLGWLNV